MVPGKSADSTTRPVASALPARTTYGARRYCPASTVRAAALSDWAGVLAATGAGTGAENTVRPSVLTAGSGRGAGVRGAGTPGETETSTLANAPGSFRTCPG